MTICIAALADDCKKLVLSADQMITANIPISYQFETDNVKKIYEVVENVVIMTAGNALFSYEIVETVKKSINPDQKSITVQEVAEITRTVYQNFRRNKVVRRFLEPRGLTLSDYLINQSKFHAGVVQEIEQNLVNFNIDVELIVAGNNSDRCHVFSITHPGDLVSHDSIGYVCVGSGSPHATYYLIGSDYKKTMVLEDVKRLVKEAKQKSEVAPGVGKATTEKILPEHIQTAEVQSQNTVLPNTITNGT